MPGEPQEIAVELPTTPTSLITLRRHLTQTKMAGNLAFESVLAKSRWSVNEEMVDVEDEPGTTLIGGEVLAILPPVSGG